MFRLDKEFDSINEAWRTGRKDFWRREEGEEFVNHDYIRNTKHWYAYTRGFVEANLCKQLGVKDLTELGIATRSPGAYAKIWENIKDHLNTTPIKFGQKIGLSRVVYSDKKSTIITSLRKEYPLHCAPTWLCHYEQG